jgi:predicted HAD superfamily phosphohydrolase
MDPPLLPAVERGETQSAMIPPVKGSLTMNKEEALRILALEMQAMRSRSYRQLASLAGSSMVVSRSGSGGTEYQIEVQIVPDNPRNPQGDIRVIASIDDGRLFSSIKPLTMDFIKSPGGDSTGD